MKGDLLPSEDHLSRCCQRLDRSVPGVITPAATSFYLYAHDYVSGNWLQYLGLPTRGDEINAVSELYKLKLRSVREKPERARIAVLHIGRVRELLHELPNVNVRFLHEPETEPVNDPSHSGI